MSNNRVYETCLEVEDYLQDQRDNIKHLLLAFSIGGLILLSCFLLLPIWGPLFLKLLLSYGVVTSLVIFILTLAYFVDRWLTKRIFHGHPSIVDNIPNPERYTHALCCAMKVRKYGILYLGPEGSLFAPNKGWLKSSPPKVVIGQRAAYKVNKLNALQHFLTNRDYLVCQDLEKSYNLTIPKPEHALIWIQQMQASSTSSPAPKPEPGSPLCAFHEAKGEGICDRCGHFLCKNCILQFDPILCRDCYIKSKHGTKH